MTHEARVALVALALCSGVVMTACTRSWAQEARCVYYEWEQVIGASDTVGPSYLHPNQVVLAQFLRSSAEDRTAAFAAMDVPAPYDEDQDIALTIEQLSTTTAEVTRGILRTRVANYSNALRNAGIPEADPGLCDLASPNG